MYNKIKFFGLWFALAYIIVITFTWIYANVRGYTYFTAGEPFLIIKYFEWFSILISIYVLTHELKNHVDELTIKRFDPLI